MNKVEELYNLYYTKVYSYVLVISKDKNVAEEITQSTFFKSIRCINQFRGDCDISTWLCSIAKNLYFDYIKKQKKIVGINENMADDENILCYLCDKEQAFSIHRILHNLEDPYKEVFTLRVFGELSFIEIGRLFEKTDNWARVTYYRAKLKIQDEMGDKVETYVGENRIENVIWKKGDVIPKASKIIEEKLSIMGNGAIKNISN